MKHHRFLSIFLTVFALATLLCIITPKAEAATVASGTCGAEGDNLTWILDDEGTLTISGAGAMIDWTSAGSVSWFSTRSSIKKVVMSNDVTSIGSYAFCACTGVTSFAVPDSVITIGSNAFLSCKALESVTLGNSVTTIGSGAFSGCAGVTSLTIPESVTTIGKSAFSECSGLIEINFNAVNVNDFSSGDNVFSKAGQSSNGIKVVFGAQVMKIPAYLFYSSGSSSARVISVEYEKDSICTSIGSSAFYNCSTLKSVTLGNSVTTIGSSAFRYCHGLTSITIPDSVTTIGSGAFYNCSKLNLATFGKNVTNIGSHAFYATYLTSVTIPEGVTTIGEQAFNQCSRLETINVPTSVTSIGDCAFFKTAWYNNQPDGLVYAGKVAYEYKGTCPEKVTLKDDTLAIAENAFDGCSTLKSVTLGNSVNTIGSSAFRYCSGLTSITIPDSVTTIEPYAFSDCTSLTSLTISESVVTIGKGAFSNCTGLTIVNFNATNMEDLIDYDSTVFDNAGQNGTGIKVTIGSKVTKIPAYLFAPRNINSSYSTKVKSVEFQKGSCCSSIGTYAFSNCGFLTSITIPDGVTIIGDNAFYACTSLTSITIPHNVTIIGKRAFKECTSLKSVTIADGVTTIGRDAFNGCSELSSITIPDSVIDIGISALDGTAWYYNQYNGIVYAGKVAYKYKGTCYGSVTIKKGTLGIAGGAFLRSTDLESIKIPDSVSIIGESAFDHCTGLTFVTIPDSVTSIGEYAFYCCSGLTDVTISDSVSSIGNCAFCFCTDLTKIIFKGNAPSFGNNAFGDVTATAYYPAYDKTWTEEVRQNYGGTLTWVPYDGSIEVGGTEYLYMAEALAACGEGQYLKLNSNTLANAVLSKDLYIDLNGFDLSGTLVTNGYKVYGMDSTTNAHTCENRGVFSCVDENGKAIIPVTHFKSDITGSVKRYMAIKDGNGYSFHRFYLGITHLNLKPGTTGVGYKAVFYGDEMVAANLDSFGYTMTLGDRTPLTAMKAASSFVSGKTVTLRIDNYDVEQYSQTDLTACVVLKLADGTVIESTAVTMTFRGLMEQLNANYTALTAEQLNAVAEMIKKYAIIISWDLKNLIAL